MNTLMDWLIWGTSPLWAFPLTWVLYVACMNIKAVHRSGYKFHWTTAVMGLLAGAVTWVLDFYLNVLTMSIVCLELPSEWTVSERLARYHQLTSPRSWRQAWRYKLSRFICTHWLNPFDMVNASKGGHC